MDQETLKHDIKQNKFILLQLEAQKRLILKELNSKCKEIKEQEKKLLLLVKMYKEV